MPSISSVKPDFDAPYGRQLDLERGRRDAGRHGFMARQRQAEPSGSFGESAAGAHLLRNLTGAVSAAIAMLIAQARIMPTALRASGGCSP